MNSAKKLKNIYIKTHTYYHFGDIININNLNIEKSKKYFNLQCWIQNSLYYKACTYYF